MEKFTEEQIEKMGKFMAMKKMVEMKLYSDEKLKQWQQQEKSKMFLQARLHRGLEKKGLIIDERI